MAHALVFLLVFHLLIFLSNPIANLVAGSTNISEIDRQALLNFQLGISDDPLGVLSSWGNVSYCSWRGITCGKAVEKSTASLCERMAGEGDAKKAPCCGTVATARAGVERLSCRTVATARAGVRVSPAVTSSHCSSMAAVLGLDW